MRNLPNLWRGLWRVKLAALASKITHCPAAYGVLYLDILHADGTRTPLGLASMRVVTDAGVGYLVDALQNLVEPENLKFHGFGTGTTAEAASQTALVTEETTQYATDNTRPTGSQTETSREHLPHGRDLLARLGRHARDHRARHLQPGRDRRRRHARPLGLLGREPRRLGATRCRRRYDFTINSGG
jgi:hypothetical protein